MLRKSNRSYLLAVLFLATTFLTLTLAGLAYSQDTSAGQQQAEPTAAGLEITLSQATGTASFIRASGGASIPLSRPTAQAIDQAAAFLAEYGQHFGIVDPGAELNLVHSGIDNFGLATLRYQQQYQGVPVYGAQLFLHFNQAGQLTAVNGRFVPNLNLNTTPALSEARAASIALAAVSKANAAANLHVSDRQLLIYHPGMAQDQPAIPRLAYHFTVTNGVDVRQFVFVDAQTGRVLDQFQGIHDEGEAIASLSRTTFDAQNEFDYSQAVVCRDEGDPPSGDHDCDSAHDFTGATYNYYFNAYGRDSLDGMGLPLHSYVHFGEDFVNAFWNGQFATYGDHLAEDDVVAHELTHGLTQFTGNMIYAYQPGALNESYSDIFGETVDFLFGNGAAAPWVVGDDVFVTGVITGGIRNMADPNLFNDPASTDDPLYHCIGLDNGGVHVNSGIPNKLYSLLVDGGSFNGQTVHGIGLAKAGAIHYAALANYHHVFSNFTDHNNALLSACTDLIGTTLHDPVTGAPLADTITTGDCAQVASAAAAVNLTGLVCQDVANEDPPPLCAAGSAPVFYLNDNQNRLGPRGWSVDTLNGYTRWRKVASFPEEPERGRMWFADATSSANPLCEATPDVTDATTLTSPAIHIPDDATTVMLNLEHYFGTEPSFDGGIIEYSVEGGPFETLPSERLVVNPYGDLLLPQAFGNTNPLALPEEFREFYGGFNRPGSFPERRFLQTHADLTGLVSAGQSLHLRFHFGQDFCFGFDGWYVDTVQVYTCSALMEVDIDILPGTSPNVIDLDTRRLIPVAILSTPDFDAPAAVDRNSLTFGRTGDEDSLLRPGGLPACRATDVNSDALSDLTCFFRTQATAFQPDDTVGILKGQTHDGAPIEGRDSVEFVQHGS